MLSKIVVVACVLSQVYCDRNLPVLFQFSQPSHNVAVFRGADVERAKAAGIIGGGSSSYSSPTPAPYTTTTPPPPPPTPAATYAPVTSAPLVYRPAPPPVAYRPAPVVYRPAPAPVVYRPAPASVVYRPAPAPVVYKSAPAPVVYQAAPASVVYQSAPAPVAYKPAPARAYAEPAYNDADAVYNWEYAVLDDPSYNNFGHKESRNGLNTEGKYYVALPDGRLQTVTYTVNGYDGYVPVVEYSGAAQYPAASKYSA